MLAKDGEMQARHLDELAQEEKLDLVRQEGESKTKHTYLVTGDESWANPEYQLGKGMFSDEFERKLKKLNPNLRFEMTSSAARDHKRVVVDRGKESFIASIYPIPFITEHCIMDTVEEEVMDPSVRHINKKDCRLNGEYVNPGLKKVTVNFGTKRRGWRAVLLQLLSFGLLDLTAVENEFGTDPRITWQAKTRGRFTAPM